MSSRRQSCRTSVSDKALFCNTIASRNADPIAFSINHPGQVDRLAKSIVPTKNEDDFRLLPQGIKRKSLFGLLLDLDKESAHFIEIL